MVCSHSNRRLQWQPSYCGCRGGSRHTTPLSPPLHRNLCSCWRPTAAVPAGTTSCATCLPFGTWTVRRSHGCKIALGVQGLASCTAQRGCHWS